MDIEKYKDSLPLQSNVKAGIRLHRRLTAAFLFGMAHPLPYFRVMVPSQVLTHFSCLFSSLNHREVTHFDSV